MGKYYEKVNTSPKQKKIKKALENLGHTNVEVWWETLEPSCEMCGMGGGYFFTSDQEELDALGYSFSEAMDAIDRENRLNKLT